jgi:L-glyceraldehyde 3-phosphate reductase
VRALNEIAAERGQTLAQMAIAWTLRDPRVTSSLIGASSVTQLENSLGALENATSTTRSSRRSSSTRVDAGMDLWEEPATA